MPKVLLGLLSLVQGCNCCGLKRSTFPRIPAVFVSPRNDFSVFLFVFLFISLVSSQVQHPDLCCLVFGILALSGKTQT